MWLMTFLVTLLTTSEAEPRPLRVATFNASLSFNEPGALIAHLESTDFEPARHAAAIIQSVRPDIILINEFDHDPAGRAVNQFRTLYLEKAQTDAPPVTYPYAYLAPVNTGVIADVDINGDGDLSLPGDAWGFGFHPGQYGMVVLSRFPLGTARTFQNLLWRDMPDNLLPTEYYGEDVASRLRLSSKSHWDIQVEIPFAAPLHLLVSHPTPPVFDGPEDRNGRRNHDEIRFWADYLSSADWMVDDMGQSGGLQGKDFVILGDLNADPCDGDSYQMPVRLLLNHPRVNAAPAPASKGGEAKAGSDGLVNTAHECPAAEDTGDFGDDGAGNLRVDYVLPSQSMYIAESGVFWPLAKPASQWLESSDHRLVWVDLIPRH